MIQFIEVLPTTLKRSVLCSCLSWAIHDKAEHIGGFLLLW